MVLRFSVSGSALSEHPGSGLWIVAIIMINHDNNRNLLCYVSFYYIAEYDSIW